MSASQALGGASRCGRVLGPSLDKIIKNAAWRKHSHLVSSCKSALDKLDSISDSSFSLHSPLFGLSIPEAEFVLQPVLLALDSSYAKVVEPALDCLFKLFSFGLLRGEILMMDTDNSQNNSNSNNFAFKLIDSICKVCGMGDESVELAVLRVLLSAVRSPCVLIRGDCLLLVVRTCYNVYLGGLSGTNQICAKSVLAQIMVIVFSRVEEDSMDVRNIRTVSVNDLLEIADKNLNEGSSIFFCQNFLNEVMVASEGAVDVKRSPQNAAIETRNGDAHLSNADDKGQTGNRQGNDGGESSGESKIRDDGFLLFKNICKLSMKFSSQENPDDQILLRGKILSLELLKVVMDNGGSIWRTNERQVIVSFTYLTHY
ncbi:hypothetical protein JRO89_XSUnG0197800 [Xanthoceras sorbifolium]|uniref:Mon2/Sec7/BIG1-like dimerisation and cyclophilin-binding domain-containing protein n=1 Tax=Xanthoceras sorbifolium TaxID=99658 RepID=A0ABQ8GX90_9ROSI|nr:hypothetical protein JRO89_XSUnG0197800 [Xanthoceras sorbifolium]